ncbi:MAG: hypothetical protein IJ152_02920 [Bacteroidales bacterium]|nr:hypothetical protein [Bacteroidales bacterium]
MIRLFHGTKVYSPMRPCKHRKKSCVVLDAFCVFHGVLDMICCAVSCGFAAGRLARGWRRAGGAGWWGGLAWGLPPIHLKSRQRPILGPWRHCFWPILAFSQPPRTAKRHSELSACIGGLPFQKNFVFLPIQSPERETQTCVFEIIALYLQNPIKEQQFVLGIPAEEAIGGSAGARTRTDFKTKLINLWNR